jgi:Papain-like cysteine protease AvrRpt2
MRNMLKGVWNTATEALGIRVLPDRLIHPRHPNVATIRIPGYCQVQTWTCGPVAALMVVHHFRPSVQAKRVFCLAAADPHRGTSVARLVRTLRGCGIQVGQRTNLGFQDIVRAVDRGRPIMTVVRTNKPGISHWVVCYGYGKRPNRVYVAANGLPLMSQREYPWGIFRQHHWTDAGFGLVCSRR